MQSVNVEIETKDDVEVLAQAFKKVCELFESRDLLVQRSGGEYDDGERKESDYEAGVKLIRSEFQKIKSSTLPNIETISADYRRKIIAEFMAEQGKAFNLLTMLSAALSPLTKWKTLASERTCAMILHTPVGAGVIYNLIKFLKQRGHKYNVIQSSKYVPIENIIYEIGKEKFDYVLLDDFDGVSIETQGRVMECIKDADHSRRIIIAAHRADLLNSELLQSCFYLDVR